MAKTEFDILEYLASQRGKSAATLYDESGGKAFTEISNELTDGKGFNIIRDVNGHAIFAINNSTGELLGNVSSDTTYGTAAETTASGYNLVTTATTTADETAGTIKTELASGANEAATSAAGKAGAALSGVTMKTAIFSGMAALGGVAKGINLYNSNPEFWTHLSKALIPYAYGETYKNTGDELGDALNALIPTAIDANGNSYLNDDFMNALAQELLNQNAFTNSYVIKDEVSNSVEYNINSLYCDATKLHSSNVKVQKVINFMQGVPQTGNLLGFGGYGSTDAKYYAVYFTPTTGNTVKFSSDGDGSYKDLSTIFTTTEYLFDSNGNFLESYIEEWHSSSSGYTLQLVNQNYDDYIYGTSAGFYVCCTNTGEFQPNVIGLTSDNSATLPEKDKDLSDTYPNWYAKALQTLNPESTLNNPTYNYWYPVSIQNEKDDSEASNTTDSQTGAQTGNNPDSTTALDAMTAAQEKIAEAIKELTKTLTKQGTDTKTPPYTPTDTGETPTPIPPIISGSSNGLWAIYNPSESELQSFGKWLWSSDIINQIVKMISNPMDAIIGLHTIYVTPPTSGTATIKAGYLDSGVSATKVSNQYTSIDCGTVTILEKYQNAIDYDYTRVSIYLPFIGIVPLNTRDVMGASLHLTYRVDVLTGTCLAQIRVTKQNSNAVLYTYSGNCAVQIPLTSGNYGTLLTGLLSAVGGVVASVASGGAALPAVAGIGSAALNSHTNVSQSGNLGSNAGALGIRKPYVLITRPTPYNAENYPSFYGIPSQKYVMLGNVFGFTKVREVHVENINATNEEKSEIENLLKGGVII